MKSILTFILLCVFTQSSHAVGNVVVDDIGELERIGFSFEKLDYFSAEKTIGFTVKIPPHHVSSYGKMPFAGAAYFKPEDAGAEEPKLILAKGLKMYLFHTDEEAGHSVRLSVLVAEVAGTYLEFTYDRGFAPMLVHVPLKTIVDSLAGSSRAVQAAAEDSKSEGNEEPKPESEDGLPLLVFVGGLCVAIGLGMFSGAAIGSTNCGKRTARQLAAAIEAGDISVVDRAGEAIVAESLVRLLSDKHKQA